MIDFEEWLPLAVFSLTIVTVLLLSLPSTYGTASRFTKRSEHDDHRIQVVVLGDIGRSPRIQYHALSIAKHGGFVELIGYTDSDLHPGIRLSPRITVYRLPPTPKTLRTDNKVLFVVLGPLKVLLQTCSLYYTLGYRVAPARWMLVQNPPTIPTLFVALLICFIRNTRLIIDWHNFGYSILALKLGPSHPLVRISRLIERSFSSKAYAHLVVSNAMARYLGKRMDVKGPVLPLHDRPFHQFQPLDRTQRSHFLAKCSETAGFLEKIRSGKMKVLVSSTSWTPDEDFSLFLNALVIYAEVATSSLPHLPEILAIVTGRGPLKEAFISKIESLTDEGKLQKVQLRTAWLSTEDYAQLLASADLGVSLHTSSSGVDLPMKVVDMLGAGLPVVGWNKFEAWPELVIEGINGRGFQSSSGLAYTLLDLFGPDTTQLEHLRQGALLEGKRRWDEEWDPVAGKLLGLCK
ncbi:MAG: hypothetical protein Q9179_006350 [Wetmoreana sp. 5 TL-2023]